MIAKDTFAWSWRLCEINASVSTAGLRGFSTTKRKRYIFAKSNFKGIPVSGAASVEFNVLNCLIVDPNRIWYANCTVRNKLGNRSSLSCLDRYSCPWKINKFSCFIFYPLTVTRTWTRRNEFCTFVFHITLVLQTTPHRNLHGPHYYQYTDLTPLPSSPYALSPIYRSNPTTIFTIRTITNIQI